VWEALPDAGGGPVAIKVAHAGDADSLRRLGREADALDRVGAPHVPALYRRGALDDGRPYLVMERLQGRLLADEMALWPGRRRWPRCRAWPRRLLASASAVATAGLLHRDLKPENVFVVRNGEQRVAKLMDFGWPWRRRPSPRTASPERRGRHPRVHVARADRGRALELASDVYTLGLMLYELYALRLPFVGEQRELEYGHLSLRPPRPSRFVPVSAAVEEVILRCLSKDPARATRTPWPCRWRTERPSPGATQSDSTEISVQQHLGSTQARVRGGEKQKVALVFAQSDQFSAAEVQAALQPFGASSPTWGPGRGACAFTHRAGDNPGPRALAAAQALVAKGLAQRLIIDVASVTVKVRPDGPPRLIGSVFSQAARYPTRADPRGSSSRPPPHPAARAAGAPAPGRPDHFLLVESTEDDRTRTRHDAGRAGGAATSRCAPCSTRPCGRWSERRPRVASVLGRPGPGQDPGGRRAGPAPADQGAGGAGDRAARPRAAGQRRRRDPGRLCAAGLQLPPRRPPTAAAPADRAPGGARPTTATRRWPCCWAGSARDHPAVQALRAAPGVLRANAARAGMEVLQQLGRGEPAAGGAGRRPLGATTPSWTRWSRRRSPSCRCWVVAFGRPGFAERRPSWGRRAAHAEA
jgi:hypothetical protein